MPILLAGMEELLERMRLFSGNVDEKQNEALYAGAMIIQRAMSDAAPTGVKNTQRWQYRARKKYAVEHLKDNIIIGRVNGRGVRRNLNVGPEEHFFYSRFFEFGTVKMAAQPFMEPAFLANKQEAKNAMKEVIARAIRDV